MCSQCLSHTGPAPAYSACTLPAHTAQAIGCSTGNRLRSALGCMHLPVLSLSGSGTRVALRGSDSVGPCFVSLPGLSSSVVWRARSLRLIAFPVSAAQFSGCTAGAPCEADGDCPELPEVLAKEPACSLVGKVSLGLRLSPFSPYGSGCLSLAGDGLQLAFSVPSFVLCSVLAVPYVRAFRVVVIPQSGLLAQVRSFWLCVGRSCPILTKHCSPHLPCVQALPPLPNGGCRRLCYFSAGGVTVGLVICWF